MKAQHSLSTDCTKITETVITIPTYSVPDPEKVPIFCENRVHQRTSGRVYPNPVVSTINSKEKADKNYKAVILENRFLRVVVLPELGGRIYEAQDKTNGYAFIYKQSVIKPALIGLLGSWISGGMEFNWPTHHRPSTYMPVDYEIEHGDEGSAILWLSEHDPMTRMKGMVGIALHPEKSRIETHVRLFNRTDFPQSFLWWENVAVPISPNYQIFFPQDVQYVVFHYKKSATSYPLGSGRYNGIDLGKNVDIRWHKNTKKATSFFAAKSKYDFFGGYDHDRSAGIMHVANHHITPGKKLFTWAHSQLSEVWERALTDTDGQYAELMAGAYSENQPDFSWIEPLETKTFVQYWYPIKEIGEPVNANCRISLSYQIIGNELTVRVYAVELIASAEICVKADDVIRIHHEEIDLLPAEAVCLRGICDNTEPIISIEIFDADGGSVISYRTEKSAKADIPNPLPDVPSPAELRDAEELYLAGLHVYQYRDPLVEPDVYWKRALELDPNHFHSNVYLGQTHLKRGFFAEAEGYLRKAVSIVTQWNGNPRNGEVFYLLGLALKYQGRFDEAYDAFYKSTWSYQWRSAGHFGLAQIDTLAGKYGSAIQHLHRSIESNAQNFKAQDLLTSVLRNTGDLSTAKTEVNATLQQNPLDYWANWECLLLDADSEETSRRERFFKGLSNPVQTGLDLAFDYAAAGLYKDAVSVLHSIGGEFPIIYYTLAFFSKQLGDDESASSFYRKAETSPAEYCFPSRLGEMEVLIRAIQENPDDSKAPYYLGNLLYDKGHYDTAIDYWERSAALDPDFYLVIRNLGIAYFNHRNDAEKALSMMERARALKPDDSMILYEMLLMQSLCGVPPEKRLQLIGASDTADVFRDDIYLETVKIHNQLGDYDKALDLFRHHTFVACEGGEHSIVEQYQYAYMALGRRELMKGKIDSARSFFISARDYPDYIGAGVWNDVMNVPCYFYEGLCLHKLCEYEKAKLVLNRIVQLPNDYFARMYFPALPYYQSRSLRLLDRSGEAERIAEEFLADSQTELAKKDYGFFTKTPFLHSIRESTMAHRERHYSSLVGLGYKARGDGTRARKSFERVLQLAPYDLFVALEFRYPD